MILVEIDLTSRVIIVMLDYSEREQWSHGLPRYNLQSRGFNYGEE